MNNTNRNHFDVVRVNTLLCIENPSGPSIEANKRIVHGQIKSKPNKDPSLIECLGCRKSFKRIATHLRANCICSRVYENNGTIDEILKPNRRLSYKRQKQAEYRLQEDEEKLQNDYDPKMSMTPSI